MARLTPQHQLAAKVVGALFGIWLLRALFFGGPKHKVDDEIAHANVFERITRGTPLGSSPLDPQKFPFLQSRIGREGDTRQDLFDLDIAAGIQDFWTRFQLPFATSRDTVHLDEQVIKGTVEELMSFNGWAAAACTTLIRPFAGRQEDSYKDLNGPGRLFYFALVVHSADHFFIDQLAVIVQMSRKLGTQHIFVSVLDYASSDSTPFLSDLAEAVLTLLSVPFRLRRVDPMTEDPAASYYPSEEAYTRNLALEPLYELYERRKVVFTRVIWLKGFTCPNDLLETLRVSLINSAAMVCSMDWKEHNGHFIYNDRWRTRDLDGNLFRGSRSTSPVDEAPPRHRASAERYNQHLPFQVFCCESGSHVVDPSQSYYVGIRYRSASEGVFNSSLSKTPDESLLKQWNDGPCMDSSQMHFCRDIWLETAKDGVKELAREAFRKQKAGKPRGLSEELEAVVRTVAPKLSVPASQSSYSAPRQPHHQPHAHLPAADRLRGKGGKDRHGNVHLTHDGDDSPQADFDKTDGVGAGRDVDAAEKAEKAKAGGDEDERPKKDVKVGGKPLPKPQDMKVKRDVVEEAPEKHDEGAPPNKEQDKLGEGEKKEAGDKKDDGEKDTLAEKPKDDAAEKPKDADKISSEGKKIAVEDDEDEDIDDDIDDEDNDEDVSGVPHLRNSAFKPVRILVNPRCITTYAGVSHTQLALDLFGDGDDVEPTSQEGGRYHFDEWEGAPSAFVCQEMRTTGGRISSKQQRRMGFQISKTLRRGWKIGDTI